MYRIRYFLMVLGGTLAVGCGSSDSPFSAGNATGGWINVGGGAASGGASTGSAGGSSNPSSGGSAITTGGTVGTVNVVGSTATAIGGSSVGGGTAGAGGAMSFGGSAANGGSVATGGNGVQGGSTAGGGATHSGGIGGIAGTATTGILVSGGGTPSTGGIGSAAGGTAVAGTSATGGSNASAGATNTGGSASAGGSVGSGGVIGTGGVVAVGGTSTSGGSNTLGGAPTVGGASASGGDMATGGTSAMDTGTSAARGCFVQTLTDDNVNVYVIKDASPTGADVEGNLYVGGNLLVLGSYSVGAKNPSGCNKYALVVAGDLSINGGSVSGGRAAAGGAISAVNVSFNCQLYHETPLDFAPLQSEVESLSLALAQLASNGTVVSTANTFDPPGTDYDLTGTDTVMNVFDIDASEMRNVNVSFPEGSTVVVNVKGTNVNWTNAAVCLNGSCADSSQAKQVIWNLHQATSVTVKGIAIEGTVLAPLATLDGGGGHIAGQVIVRNLTGGIEYHLYPFQGCIKWL